jgi:hypothetical protein
MPFHAHLATEHLPISTFNFWQPSPMRAFMTLTKRIPHLIDAAVEFQSGKLTWCIAIDDFSGSDEESFFVPLVARTVLPVHAADVAEFGAAFATALKISDLYGGGRKRGRTSCDCNHNPARPLHGKHSSAASLAPGPRI